MVAPRLAADVLALVVLPLFVIPAKRVGRRLQAISRAEHGPQRRDEHADDRAVQRRRRAAGEAVRPPRRRDRRRSPGGPAEVRDIGIRSAMYGRVFFVALGLVGALGAAAVYGVGGQLVISGTHHARHARRPRRARRPDLRAAHRADQRPRRPDDRVRQLRAGVRGARRPERDHRPARRRRPRRRRAGAVELDDVWFRYPPAAASRSPRSRRRRPLGGADADRDVLRGVVADDRAGRDSSPSSDRPAPARRRSPR